MSTIIGYTYQADTYCPGCIVERGISGGWLAPAARDAGAEDALDQAQHYFLIDRTDEHSYDSGEFPKVIFHAEDGEACADCGSDL